MDYDKCNSLKNHFCRVIKISLQLQVFYKKSSNNIFIYNKYIYLFTNARFISTLLSYTIGAKYREVLCFLNIIIKNANNILMIILYSRVLLLEIENLPHNFLRLIKFLSINISDFISEN